MYLESRYIDVSNEDIIQNTGFELDVSKSVLEPIPSDLELEVLRNEVDPQCLIMYKQ
jgi:glutaconate CoA-transferase subunit B